MISLLAMCLIAQAHSAEPTISTVAGGGAPLDMQGMGDGGPATEAYLSWPRGVAVDGAGNLYIADTLNSRVRKVTRAGTITTIAGVQGDGIDNGKFNGDGIPATQAELSAWAVDVDGLGNIYVADKQNARIRRIAPSGIITTVAGSGVQGFSGDGGPATSARLNQPDDVAVDAAGNLYILDQGNQRVRKVSAGIITTLAGSGQAGFSGDGGQARLASLNNPQAIAVDAWGNLFIADTGNDRVRRVSADGKIQTFAGGGPFRVDPLAINSTLEDPLGVAVDASGNVYLSEGRGMVRMVGGDGVMRTVAGTYDDISGIPTSNSGLGDGGPATAAGFETPEDLVLDASRNILIADRGNGRIRKVTPIPGQPTPLGLRGFRPYTLTQVSGPLRDVISGDVTGDGRDDVIMTTGLGRFAYDPAVDLDVIIMVQRPDGTLGAPTRLDYPSVGYRGLSSFGGKLALGDFDRDGVKDIAISHETGVDLVLGSRAAAFVVRSFNGTVMPEVAMDIAVMDVDRDGNPDVVAQAITTTWSSNMGIRIYYGNGAGAMRSFNEVNRLKFVDNLVVADFTGDGAADLAYLYQGISDTNDHGIEVMPQAIPFGFRPAVVHPMGSHHVEALSAGDFNGDGRADLVFAQSISEEGIYRSALALVAQGASGQLQAAVHSRTYSYASDSAVGNVDGNGRGDLVVLYPGDNAIGYFPQTGNGLGRESKYFVPGLIPEERPSIATGDVNHDGLRDVLVAVPGQGLAILHGNRRPLRALGSQPRVPGRVSQTAPVPARHTVSDRPLPARPAASPLRTSDNGAAREARESPRGYVEGAARMIRRAVVRLHPAVLLDSAMRWARPGFSGPGNSTSPNAERSREPLRTAPGPAHLQVKAEGKQLPVRDAQPASEKRRRATGTRPAQAP